MNKLISRLNCTIPLGASGVKFGYEASLEIKRNVGHLKREHLIRIDVWLSSTIFNYIYLCSTKTCVQTGAKIFRDCPNIRYRY